MKPVFQDRFYSPDDDLRGNCVAACVASIFEYPYCAAVGLPDATLPEELAAWTVKHHPALFLHEADFRSNYREVAEPSEELPYGRWDYDDPEDFTPPHPGYWIASVYSPRVVRPESDAYYPHPGLHAVVMKGERCVHDPHPEGAATEEQPVALGAEWWAVADPAKLYTSRGRM
jgi:hypothetical protein